MNRFLRLCLPVLVMFSLASCLKEKSIDSTEDGGTSSLRMKIDGKQWTANKAASASVVGGFVVISGQSQDNINLVINIETTTAGTFQLDQASDHVAVVLDNNEASPVAYTTDQGANSSIAGGTVNITKIDAATKRISGTFNIKVYRSTDDKTLLITEGVFDNLPFTNTPPPSGNNNTLSMKVEGVDFVPAEVTANISDDDILITAEDASATKLLSLTVPKDIPVGTYVLDNIGFYLAFYTSGSKIYGAGPAGVLDITEHDPVNRTLKGTFSFTGEDQGTPPGANVAVTNGSFSVTY